MLPAMTEPSFTNGTCKLRPNTFLTITKLLELAQQPANYQDPHAVTLQ